MFMLVLHILCHNLVGYESSRGLGTKIAECGYETSKPGYESSGYERSMGTKRLVTDLRPRHGREEYFVFLNYSALYLCSFCRFRDIKKIYEDEKKYGFGFLQTK